VMVLIYSLFVVRPLLRLVRASARYPEAASWVLMTLLGCALLLVFPAIQRWIHQATDRWLFRRPDYRQLVQAFAVEIERAEDEEQLFALIRQQLQTALQVETVRILPHSGTNPPEASTLLSVKVNANAGYWLAIEPGKEGRKLLSDELAFLDSLAELVGRRIETLQFERERRERELHEARLQHSWKLALTQAELRALQAQINPHFLFNTLNTIADLIGSEPEKAEQMTERLAEVFRYVLTQSEASLISVREEFDFLQTYLAIEQVRFGERLKVEMKIDPAVAHLQIPPLILQPLVENAIKHGLSSKREGGRISIRAEQEKEALRLTVEDDGIGWNNLRSANGTGVGLKNVRERLQAVYDGRAELQVESVAGQGTQIHIVIPNHEAQNVDHRRRSVGPLAADETARRAS
jgi:two-component system, LytTR family, sensor kinase